MSKKVATEIFNTVPTMEAVWITEDNQGFDNEHSAINHQKEITGKRSLNDDDMPKKYTRDILESKPTATKAEDLIKSINEATTVEVVNELLGEDKRATVVKAAENKIAELNAATTKETK